MPELTPEMVSVLNAIIEHDELCGEGCDFISGKINELKALGYTFTVVEIGAGEIL